MAVDLGTMYRATLVGITDATGSAVNPATISYTVTLPDQTTASVTPVSDGAAPDGSGWQYHADYLTAQEGLHRGQWSTTVPNISEPDYFNVTFYRAVLGLDEVKDWLGLLHEIRFDGKLRGIIAAATGLVEERCGTCVIRTFTDDFIPQGDREVLRLPHGPVPDASSVSLVRSQYTGGPSWTAADLLVSPHPGTVRTANRQGFYYGPWLATYKAGRLVIPAGLVNGVKEIIWDVWSTQRAVGYDQEDPTVEEVAAMEQTLAIPADYRIPIKALEFLDPHTMPGFA